MAQQLPQQRFVFGLQGYKKNVTQFFKRSPRQILLSLLILSLVSNGLLDSLFFNVHNAKVAEAAYSGKILRTVEFALGGGAGAGSAQTGTDQVTGATVRRASDANVYAGTSWNTTKGSAGTKTIKLPGSGIRVISAYLDATAAITSATSITDVEMAIDVSPGPQAGVDMEVSPEIRVGNMFNQSGQTGILSSKTDVTGFFQIQNDSQWNTGLSVVGMLSVTGPTWALATMKLVITYEENHTTAPYNSMKTVRLPLTATTTGDVGTRATSCGANVGCSFKYLLDLPDLATTSDIGDVFFEISYIDDGAATTTTGIRGGAATVANGATNETIADNNERFYIYTPLLGSNGIATGTVQYLDITPTSAISALGAELVITYKFSTGAATQVDTVRYFMNQDTALPGTATTSAISYAMTVSNAGLSITNLWYRAHVAITAGQTITIDASIGNSASTTRGYQITAANARAGSVRIIHDAGTATTSWSGSSAIVRFSSAQSSSAADAPIGVETFITFKWSGSLGGTVTKSDLFFVGQSSSGAATANITTAFPFSVELSETVTKTYRSAYYLASILHSNATTITAGTVKLSSEGDGTITYNEGTEDTEAYRMIVLKQATSTNFTQDTTIPWNERTFNFVIQGNQTNTYYSDAAFAMTYDAALPLPTSIETRAYRWRANDGSEVEASYRAAENSPLITGTYVGDKLRLRFSLKNSGEATTTTRYRLEYSSSTCTAWQAVPAYDSGGDHWMLTNTEYANDLSSTTDSSGVSDPGGSTFTPGYFLTSGNISNAQSLPQNYYSEFEVSVRSTSAVTPATTYCFRLTNDGNTNQFIYTITPQITITSTVARPQAGGLPAEASTSGTQQTGGGQGGGQGTESGSAATQQTGGNQGGGGGDAG